MCIRRNVHLLNRPDKAPYINEQEDGAMVDHENALDLDSKDVPNSVHEFLTQEVYGYCLATVKAAISGYYAWVDTREEAEITVAELALAWPKIVAKYDSTRTSFIRFVAIELAYRARRRLSKSLGKRKELGTDVTEDTACYDMQLVNRLVKQEQCGQAMELLKRLTAEESWVVWNHIRGFTFEELALSLQKSRNTVQNLHRGAMDKLHRLAVETGLLSRMSR